MGKTNGGTIMTNKERFKYFELGKKLSYWETPNDSNTNPQKQIRENKTIKEVIKIMKKENQPLKVIPVFGSIFRLQPENIDTLEKRLDESANKWLSKLEYETEKIQ